MNENDAVGHYLDWASPTFYDTLTAALQELMAKQTTPEQFLEKLEADHAAFLPEGEGGEKPGQARIRASTDDAECADGTAYQRLRVNRR